MAKLSDKGLKKIFLFLWDATRWRDNLVVCKAAMKYSFGKTNQATLENVFCYVRAIQETSNGLALRASIRHSWERIYSSGVERCQGVTLRRALLPLIWWKTNTCEQNGCQSTEEAMRTRYLQQCAYGIHIIDGHQSLLVMYFIMYTLQNGAPRWTRVAPRASRG